jgi:hypothetical protein
VTLVSKKALRSASRVCRVQGLSALLVFHLLGYFRGSVGERSTGSLLRPAPLLPGGIWFRPRGTGPLRLELLVEGLGRAACDCGCEEVIAREEELG